MTLPRVEAEAVKIFLDKPFEDPTVKDEVQAIAEKLRQKLDEAYDFARANLPDNWLRGRGLGDLEVAMFFFQKSILSDSETKK